MLNSREIVKLEKGGDEEEIKRNDSSIECLTTKTKT
jgi:hypothetical protein